MNANRPPPRPRSRPREDDEIFPINYQWSTSDGIICRGHSVCSGRDQARAERRFFKQHPHVNSFPDSP